jgi:hypothetical protein
MPEDSRFFFAASGGNKNKPNNTQVYRQINHRYDGRTDARMYHEAERGLRGRFRPLSPRSIHRPE